MADDNGPGRQDDDKSNNETIPPEQTSEGRRAKRRLKPTQSIREQSELATAKAAAPRKRGIVSRILGAPFRLLGRLLAKIFGPVFRFLGRYRFFRIIGYILVPPYFRSAWRELRQVTWPDFRTTRDLTFAVIVFSIIFGLIVAAVDWGLDKIFRNFILN